MAERYYLGVDVGTYSSKGVLVREDGHIIADYSIPHAMSMPQPGYFEQDADQVWWHDFVHITRKLLETSQADAHSIRGVAASGIGPCVLPVGDRGQPLRPGILYGIDTRASAEITALEGILGRDTIIQWTAAQLSSQAAGPKVLWIRNHEPEVFARARWFLTSQAYLVYRLTAQASIDVYTAGYYAPLYDVFRREWIADAAEAIAPLERLPKACWSHEVVGTVTAEAAAQTGLMEGTQVVAGTADAAAEAVSAGMAHVGDMLLMLGSSIFFILQTHALVRTQRFWSSNFLQEDTYAYAGGMSTAGSLTTWFRDQFAPLEVAAQKAGGLNAYAALAAQAAQAPVGANGLIALPYFEGERTPMHDSMARGLWFGLSLKHTRADLYRALLEGVAYGIRHNIEAMAEEGMQSRRILVAGGGARNRLWLQIIADVCGIDLVVPNQLAGASYGDAFLASIGTGQHNDLSEIGAWVSPNEVIHPQPQHYAQYNTLYPIFRALYENTKTLMRRLAETQ